MIKGIIFDLDGTLLNTLDDICIAVNYMLKKLGYPKKSIDEIRDALGYGATYLIKETTPDGLSEEKLIEALNIYQAYYDMHRDDNTAPYPNVVEVIERLSEKGYKLAIVSNKVDHLVKSLNKTTFKGLIDVAVGEIKGVPVKPDPTSVVNTIKELGLTSKEVIYVGDTEVDVLTAKRANLYCVGCTWGFRPREVLEKTDVDIIIDDAFELLEVVGDLNG